MAKHIFFLMVWLTGLLSLAACAQPAGMGVQEITALPTDTAVSSSSIPPTPSPTTAVSEPLAQPALDEFYETVLRDILLRDPEYTTGVGLPAEIALPVHDQLTNESAAYEAETYELLAAHLATLQSYDWNKQTDEQRISTATLAWYLEDVLRQRPYQHYDYRMNPIFGFPFHFPNLMTGEHPLTNLEEAEAYVSRLQQFATKADQLVEGLQLAEDQGVLPPQWMLNWVIGDLQGTISGPAERIVFYQHFADALAGLDNISAADKERLLAEAETAVSQSIIPGYEKIITFMQGQVSRSNNRGGALHHPDGAAYYQTQLQHHTTTDLTADEIHEIGLTEVARIQAEMRPILTDLGYDADAPLGEVMAQAGRDSGTLTGEAAVLAEYERLIAEAETAVLPYFDILPQAELVVDTIPSGTAYYLTPALDGSRPGIFYAVVGNGAQSRLRIPTTTYHEAIPGHHFQIALQSELEDVPTFRKVFLYTAYAEGWGLYAEQLAAEIGLYEDDPYGNLGRLQMELFRTARLVVDTGIHAQGWTHQEAVDYMVENTGLPQEWVEFEVSRYTLWPGQATSYKIGQLKINELRDLAQAELGDNFDLREFHNVILQNGAVPLPVLEMVVLDYIEDNR